MDEQPEPLRLCVDLNIWVRQFLSTVRGGRTDTASHVIVRAVQGGRAEIGPVQLVVSHTMLSRLADVLTRFGALPGDADAFVGTILNMAVRGPAMVLPYVVLGGGVEPSAESGQAQYDPYDRAIVPRRIDDEDGRVLDTAIAGRAHVLATLNLADYDVHGDEVIEPGYIRRRRMAHHELLVMHADRVAQWLRTGAFPDPQRLSP